MNKLITLLSLTVVPLLIVGCEYESPLTEEHNIPVDSSIQGLWVAVPDPGEKQDSETRMLVLKYSDTEYLIQYPDGIYYRGYPIEIGGVSCIQLEIIGNENGQPDHEKKNLFHVAKYEFKQGFLDVRLINTDIVKNDLKKADSLRKAFLENIGHKELFEEPCRFKACIVVHE